MDVRTYIFRLITAALLCGILHSFPSEKTTVGKIGRMLSGLVIVILMISPVTQISFKDLTWYLDDLAAQADEYATAGKIAAENSINGIIKKQTEAYIFDKAESLGLEIAVEVELNGDNNSVPCGVTIKGEASPFAKEIMSAYIEMNLGIP